MRRLKRLPLSVQAMALLDKRTHLVAAAPDRRAKVKQLWEQKDNAAFREIRDTLRTMASGRARCMYCEDSAAKDIEHFWPKADYPLKAFDWLNYLLACGDCNSNNKRNQFPLDASGRPLLLDPTVDEPMEHLSLSPSSGRFTNLTPKGQESIKVFGLNRGLLEKGREAAWRGIERMLLDYDGSCERGDLKRADKVKEDLRQSPFASVFVWFIRIATGPHARYFVKNGHLDARCLAVLEKYPDIKNWL